MDVQMHFLDAENGCCSCGEWQYDGKHQSVHGALECHRMQDSIRWFLKSPGGLEDVWALQLACSQSAYQLQILLTGENADD